MQVYVVSNESPHGEHSVVVGIYSTEAKAVEVIDFLKKETPEWFPTYTTEDVDPEEPFY